MLETGLKQYIDDEVNPRLRKTSTDDSYHGYQALNILNLDKVYFNATLMEDPILNNDYIALPFDGSLHSNSALNDRKNGKDIQPTFPEIPVYAGDSKDQDATVQVLLTDVIMNVGLQTLFENEELKVGSFVPSAAIKTIFSNWQEVYGKREVWVQIDGCCRENSQCEIPVPTINIENGVTNINTQFRVRLMNPLNKDYEAVDMTIKLNLELEFELHKDFFLICDIKNMKVEVLKFVSHFNSRLTATQMTNKLNSLLEAAVEIANKLFAKGRVVPKVPESVMNILNKTRMFAYDHFYLLEISPVVKE